MDDFPSPPTLPIILPLQHHSRELVQRVALLANKRQARAPGPAATAARAIPVGSELGGR